MKARRIISLSIALVTLLACLLPLQAGALEYPTPEGVSSALLYNVESGSALIDVQGGKTVTAGDTVLLMTALVSYDALSAKMDEQVTLTEAMLAGKKGYELASGNTVRISGLFSIMLLRGAEDATAALVSLSGMSASAFTEKMNERARTLGMTDTVYQTPYPSAKDSKTTARDTALLASAFYGVQTLRDMAGAAQTSVNISGRTVTVRSRSALDYDNGYMEFTRTDMHALTVSNSADMLVAATEKDDLSYVAVIFGASPITWTGDGYTVPIHSSYKTAIDLLSFAQSGFSYHLVFHAYDIVGELPVSLSRQTDKVTVVPERDVYCFIAADVQTEELRVVYDYEKEELSAPVRLGERVGSMRVYLEDTLLCEVDLVTNHTVSKSLLAELASYALYILLHPITLILIAALIFLRVCAFIRAARLVTARGASLKQDEPAQKTEADAEKDGTDDQGSEET